MIPPVRLTTPGTVHLHVDMKSSPAMPIGDLAAMFGLAPHVLRHWEQTGLLTPVRSGAGRRVYGPADVTRVGMILLAKEAGLSLDQVRRLLTDGSRDMRGELYREHGERLRQRIDAARAALAMIEHAAECDADELIACPHLQAKVTGLVGGLDVRGGAHPPGVGDQLRQPFE
jgi:MerR family copper efflux transcriptional regulator